ncbi:MAG: methyltransferase domain-containing protein, partial [Candidatus Lokiarchaeota archaeon]|nr:methyltransferase domain-containing protein [Candidatus Lokiarchaeota archaeon]
DITPETITKLKEKVNSSEFKNIDVKIADITQPFDLDDNVVDVCFIATALHCIDLEKHGKFIYKEIKCVLKPDGKLVVIDCKKEDVSFGPPMNMRISPEELEKTSKKYGFKKIKYTDLGFNYMTQFKAVE